MNPNAPLSHPKSGGASLHLSDACPRRMVRPRDGGDRGAKSECCYQFIMPQATDLEVGIAEHVAVTTCGARAASLAELRALRALRLRQVTRGTVQPEGGHCDTWSDAREARACESRAWRRDHPTQPPNGPADAQRR